MYTGSFDDVVEGLCRAVDLQPWQDVARGRHLQVAGRVVGLVPSDEGSGDDSLSVYVELDPLADYVPDFGIRLLRENVRPAQGLSGFFGVDATTACVVYCFRVENARVLTGAELAALIENQVGEAERALERLAQHSSMESQP